MKLNSFLNQEVNECKPQSPTFLKKIEGKILSKIAGNNNQEYSKPKQKDRIKKALDIFNLHEYNIVKINGDTYQVKSQSDKKKFYNIKTSSGNRFGCDCKDFIFRYDKLPNHECKHIMSVKALILTKKRSVYETPEPDQTEKKLPDLEKSNEISCQKCGEQVITKYGTYSLKSGVKKQKFRCVQCGYVFAIHIDGFENMMYDPWVVTEALNLIASGLSLRKTASHITIYYGKKISHSSLVSWMKKFTSVMKYYTDKLRPLVSDTWLADELMLNVKDCEGTEKGKLMVMWNILDPKTKFWIASHISQQREIVDARRAFKKGKMITGTNPKQVITDSYPAYPTAIACEFPVNDLISPDFTTHIKYPSISHTINNNRIERLHNEIREKTNNMRGVGNHKSAEIFAEFLRIYHNYVREHTALENQTPAEVAGINLKLGSNRLYSLIRQSAQKFNEDNKFTIALRKKKLLNQVKFEEKDGFVRVIPKSRYLNETWLKIHKILEKYGFEWKKIEGRYVWIKGLDRENN